MAKLFQLLGLSLLGLTLSCGTPAKKQMRTTSLEKIVAVENKKTFHKGSLEKHGRVHILHLEGTPYEMGYQHGILLNDEIQDGVVPFYSKFIENMVTQNLKGPNFTKFLITSFVNFYHIAPFRSKIPPSAREEIKGLADATGISYNNYLKLVAMPDTGASLLNQAYNFLERGIQEFDDIPSGLGCSSFVAAKEGTKIGKMIHGRNLDYQGVGFWDKHPTVIFYHPNKGQPYVSISSAGVGLAGITGMNESGLTLALHQNHSRETGTEGTPIMAINNEVIRDAHNIEEAIEIITKLKPSAGWSLVISDWKTREAVVVETSSERIRVRGLKNGILVDTNHYVIEEMKKTERNLSPARTIDSYLRYQRLEELLKENYGRIDVKKAIKFLGDHYDPATGKERTVINTITRGLNLGSVLFVPEDGNFWVATGEVPVSNSLYIGFNMKDRSIKLPSLEGNQLSTKEKRSAMHHHVQAYRAHFQEHDIEKTLALLERCIEDDPQEPLYYDNYGWILLKEKNYEKALKAFRKAGTLEQIPYRRALNFVWLGHTQDLLNQRAEAKESYQKALQISNMPSIVKAANKGLEWKYSERRIKKLRFDFSLGDVIRE